MPFSGLPAQLNAALRPPKGDSTGELAGILLFKCQYCTNVPYFSPFSCNSFMTMTIDFKFTGSDYTFSGFSVIK
jgi:hypothetical protein